MIFQSCDFSRMLYKKILFQSSYLKISCLIQYITSHFFVIICKTYQQFLSANCFKVNTTPVFFSVSNEETLLRSSEDTIQQRHRHVLAHFSCNTACVYLPDLCVSVCRPVPVTPSVPDREEQVAYTADRGHRVQQIMSIKCGPRAWNTVKPSAKGREGRKKRVY